MRDEPIDDAPAGDLIDDIVRNAHGNAKPPQAPKFPDLNQRQKSQLREFLEWLHPEQAGDPNWEVKKLLANAIRRDLVRTILAYLEND